MVQQLCRRPTNSFRVVRGKRNFAFLFLVKYPQNPNEHEIVLLAQVICDIKHICIYC